jgi:hypothetical protein
VNSKNKKGAETLPQKGFSSLGPNLSEGAILELPTTRDMEFVKLSCDANNRGVALLAGGQSHAAIGAFKEALYGMKSAAGAEEDEDVSTAAALGFAPGAAVEVREASVHLRVSSWECYAYGHPLLIYRSPLVPPGADTSSLTLYSSVILFNMALACHHIGRTRGRDAAFAKAAALYQMSLRILSVDWEGAAEGVRRSASFLAFLALNNRSLVLHHDLCDYGRSRRCLKAMAKILHGAEGAHVVRSLQASLSEPDLESILLNVRLLKAPSAAGAA